jgi:hypothetical protein
MTTKKIVMAMALLLGATTATLAQSAFTTGTLADSAAAGYPSTYGYEGGLYNYAPNHGHGHAAMGRAWRAR